VLLSRQIATLFEAQVSALRVFRLACRAGRKPFLRNTLAEISDDLQAGSSISKALAKHPKVFSILRQHGSLRRGVRQARRNISLLGRLYRPLLRAHQQSTQCARLPGFIMLTFVAVMVLMLTLVIPKIGAIIETQAKSCRLSLLSCSGSVIFLSITGYSFSSRWLSAASFSFGMRKRRREDDLRPL
jgi:MSHA biogenesis protein MshG